MWYTTIDHVRAPDIVAAPTKKSMCNTHTHIIVDHVVPVECAMCVLRRYAPWLFCERLLTIRDRDASIEFLWHWRHTIFMLRTRARVQYRYVRAWRTHNRVYVEHTIAKKNKTNSGMGHVLHIAAHKIHPYQTPTTTNWFNLYHVRVAQVVLTVCCTVCTARSHTHKLFIH